MPYRNSNVGEIHSSWGRTMRPISTLRRDERGASAVEYALILALIVLAMIGALMSVASTTTGMWNSVSTQVSSG